MKLRFVDGCVDDFHYNEGYIDKVKSLGFTLKKHPKYPKELDITNNDEGVEYEGCVHDLGEMLGKPIIVYKDVLMVLNGYLH